MPKIYEIATGEKGPGNIIDETVLSQGGAITATTPAFTDDRNLDTSTNTAPTVRRFKRRTTGTPAAGIGAGVDFEVQTGAANFEIGAVIQAVTTDVTSTSEDFALVFKTMAAGSSAAENMRVSLEVLGLKGDACRIHTPFNGTFSFSGSGASNTSSVYFDSTSVGVRRDDGYAFTNSATNATTTKTAGMHQKAAGIIEFNNGTKGTYTGIAYGAGSQTVAQLPAAATAGKGARSFVTDATATHAAGVGTVVTGGGANNVPVYSDATNWLIG